MIYSDDSQYEKRNLKSFSNGDISCNVIGLEKEGIQMLSQISSRMYQKIESFAMASEKEILETSAFNNQYLFQDEVTISDDPNKMLLDPLLISIAENNASILFFLMPAHQAKELVPKIAIHTKQQKSISFVLLFSTETNQEASETHLQEGIDYCKDFFDGVIPVSGKLVAENRRLFQNHLTFDLVEIMCQNIRNLNEIISDDGLINIDIEDVLTILKRPYNLLNIHTVSEFGENRAQACLTEYFKYFKKQNLIESEQHHIIMYLSVSDLEGFAMEELDLLTSGLTNVLRDDCEIIFGVNINTNLPKDSLKLSLLLTSSTDANFIAEIERKISLMD